MCRKIIYKKNNFFIIYLIIKLMKLFLYNNIIYLNCFIISLLHIYYLQINMLIVKYKKFYYYINKLKSELLYFNKIIAEINNNLYFNILFSGELFSYKSLIKTYFLIKTSFITVKDVIKKILIKKFVNRILD